MSFALSLPFSFSLPPANSLECGNPMSSLSCPGFQDLLERAPCAFVSSASPVLGFYWFSAQTREYYLLSPFHCLIVDSGPPGSSPLKDCSSRFFSNISPNLFFQSVNQIPVASLGFLHDLSIILFLPRGEKLISLMTKCFTILTQSFSTLVLLHFCLLTSVPWRMFSSVPGPSARLMPTARLHPLLQFLNSHLIMTTTKNVSRQS